MEYRTRAAVKITAAALAALAIGLIVKYVMLPAENPLDKARDEFNAEVSRKLTFPVSVSRGLALSDMKVTGDHALLLVFSLDRDNTVKLVNSPETAARNLRMIYCNEESFLKPLALFGKAVFRFTYENQETASMPVTFDDCRNTLEDLKEKAGSDVSGASGKEGGKQMRGFLRKGACALIMAAAPLMAAPAVSGDAEGDAEGAAALALLSAGISGKEGQPLSLKEVIKINTAVQLIGLPKKVSRELVINSLYVTPGSEMYVEGQIADPKYDESVRGKLASMDRKTRIAEMCRYPLVKAYLSRLKLVEAVLLTSDGRQLEKMSVTYDDCRSTGAAAAGQTDRSRGERALP